jgi:hypothetical protein
MLISKYIGSTEIIEKIFIMAGPIKRILVIFIIIMFILPLLSGCDPSFIDIFTEIDEDYSGTRTVDISVKTEYLRQGEVVLEQNQSLLDRLLEVLPEGEIKTYEEEGYTHFTSKIVFDDINFVKHISIDEFSSEPSQRFLAKMSIDEYFFYRDIFFEDYVDMNIDEALLSSGDANSDFNRLHDLASADSSILNITYQLRFPVKIVVSNADVIGENNIAIWNIPYGQEQKITIEGKKTKFLSYFLVVILGILGLFILIFTFILIFGSRLKRRPARVQSQKTYDNYFKRDRYFNDDDRDEV